MGFYTIRVMTGDTPIMKIGLDFFRYALGWEPIVCDYVMESIRGVLHAKRKDRLPAWLFYFLTGQALDIYVDFENETAHIKMTIDPKWRRP